MTLSPRLRVLVDSLPIERGMRVIEIGSGPGAAARAVADLVGPDGHVLAVDRSARAIAQLRRTSTRHLATGQLTTRCCAAEDLTLEPHEQPYDLAFAFRVGALDGRHPEASKRTLDAITRSLAPHGRLFIGHDDTTIELRLPRNPDPPGAAPEAGRLNMARTTNGISGGPPASSIEAARHITDEPGQDRQ